MEAKYDYAAQAERLVTARKQLRLAQKTLLEAKRYDAKHSCADAANNDYGLLEGELNALIDKVVDLGSAVEAMKFPQ